MGGEFLLHRLDIDSWKFSPSIPMVCADMPRCLAVLETEAGLDETSATAEQFDMEMASKTCAICKKGFTAVVRLLKATKGSCQEALTRSHRHRWCKHLIAY